MTGNVDRGDVMLRLERYVIERILHECTCDRCGFPMYLGDRVTWDSETETPYCSVRCAKRATGASRARVRSVRVSL